VIRPFSNFYIFYIPSVPLSLLNLTNSRTVFELSPLPSNFPSPVLPPPSLRHPFSPLFALTRSLFSARLKLFQFVPHELIPSLILPLPFPLPLFPVFRLSPVGIGLPPADPSWVVTRIAPPFPPPLFCPFLISPPPPRTPQSTPP